MDVQLERLICRKVKDWKKKMLNVLSVQRPLIVLETINVSKAEGVLHVPNVSQTITHHRATNAFGVPILLSLILAWYSFSLFWCQERF